MLFRRTCSKDVIQVKAVGSDGMSRKLADDGLKEEKSLFDGKCNSRENVNSGNNVQRIWW